MNSFNGVGRLTADVDLRYTQQGTAVANFTLAINRPFKNASGEQEADFLRVVAWRAQAENVANFVKKGERISVTGRMETGSYDDKDGKKVFTVEVVADNIQFLETKGDRQQQGNTNQAQTTQKQETTRQPESQGEPIDISDDDLPF